MCLIRALPSVLDVLLFRGYAVLASAISCQLPPSQCSGSLVLEVLLLMQNGE